MRIGRLLRGLALVLFAALLAPQAAAQADKPALWSVAGPKGKVYLFGSLHLLPAGADWRTPAVTRALEEAGTVVFETDIDAVNDEKVLGPLIAKYGLLPGGQTLPSVLPAKTNAEFERIATELGLQPSQMSPMRPWLAGLMLAAQFFVQQGYDPAKGVDQQALAWARQNGKRIAMLESVDSQLKVFADLTREQEIRLLAVSLQQIRETPGLLAQILAAYRKGDVAALERTLNAGMDELPALRRRVLGDRHVQWLPRIEKMIADGGNYVVIVGAAHLVGSDSVVAMLRAKGHRVEGP